MTADTVRRWANLLLSIAQIAVTIACFAFGTSFDQAAGAPSADPPIVPAGYAFTIWSVIYAGCVAYGLYQFKSSRAADSVLRRIGWFTASGFLGCCAWLLAVRTGHLPWTVPCIYWMAASLLAAFARLWSVEPARTGGSLFRLFVVAPISIYSGWLSVAIFANTASVAPVLVSRLSLLGSSGGSIVLILAAAGLAATLLRRSHNNLWYAGTILWALAAIAIRNQFELRNTAVAATAWTMLAVFAVLTAAMLRMQLPSNAPQRRRG